MFLFLYTIILKSFFTYETKTKLIFADVKGFQFHRIPIRILISSQDKNASLADV